MREVALIREGYKDSPLGEIPEDWELVKLGAVTKSYAGGTPKRNNIEYYNGIIPWVKSGEVAQRNILITEEHVSELALKDSATRLITPDSVLVALYGATAGKVGVLRVEACSNQAVLAINSTGDNLTNEFIYHYLSLTTPKLLSLTQGSGQPNLSKGIIDSTSIPLPPLSEQQKIAKILTTVDDKIEVIAERIVQTQELKKGLMQQLLTKGIGHTELKESPLGEIPESWDAKKLVDICYFFNGKGHEQAIDGNGKYVLVNSKFISSDGTVRKYTNNALTPLNQDDITMVMSDVPNGKAIAKCFIVDQDDTYTLNQRIGGIRVIDSDMKFMYYVIDRNKYYLSFDDGLGQTNLRKDQVLNCPIPFPPFAEQQKIAEILSTVDDKIDSLKEKKDEFQVLKKGLMQQLLTGKMRVKTN